MALNEYHFITNWRFEATRQEIIDILGDAEDLPRWWPSVYMTVTRIEKGAENRVGDVYDLYTKGWLPYTLRWRLRVTENREPEGSTLVAEGDFVGRGIWTFTQDGDMVDVEYDWKISAQKPLLKLLSPLMKPLFAANHRWAMEKGEASLKLELARRRAKSPEDAAKVPAAPPPTFARFIRKG
jgi:hypothetical protein